MNAITTSPGDRPAQAGTGTSADTTSRTTHGHGASAAIVAIRGYQLLRAGRVSPCRFTPTCSEYAVEALRRHGLRRGLSLTLRRLARCRPGGPFGADPVPD